jgi:hypothetical protein
MHEKSWTDQPNEVENCKIIGEFQIKDKVVQIRSIPQDSPVPMNSKYYVTIGNLFGSETILCATADLALYLICNLKKGLKLPDGCKLVE